MWFVTMISSTMKNIINKVFQLLSHHNKLTQKLMELNKPFNYAHGLSSLGIWQGTVEIDCLCDDF